MLLSITAVQLMRDAALVCEMLVVCATKLDMDDQYEKPLCQLITVCG